MSSLESGDNAVLELDVSPKQANWLQETRNAAVGGLCYVLDMLMRSSEGMALLLSSPSLFDKILQVLVDAADVEVPYSGASFFFN